MTDNILSDEELLKILHYIAFSQGYLRQLRDVCEAQAYLTASQKDAEIASLQADIEELNILSRCNSEVYDTRIKELEEQNEQLRIGELVIVTEQKQKEQIIAETKAPLMAKIKELEVKTGSCRGCDQFFSTQISEAKAEARREAQEVYMPYIKLLGDELDGLVGIATVHGWKSTKYEEGVKCREAIAKLNGVMPEEGK